MLNQDALQRPTYHGGCRPSDPCSSTTSSTGTSTEGRRCCSRSRLRTFLVRSCHLIALYLLILQGDQGGWTQPSTIQVLGPYRREKDHTGMNSWSLALSWQGVEVLIYTGTERGAGITEAILRGRMEIWH